MLQSLASLCGESRVLSKFTLVAAVGMNRLTGNGDSMARYFPSPLYYFNVSFRACSITCPSSSPNNAPENKQTHRGPSAASIYPRRRVMLYWAARHASRTAADCRGFRVRIPDMYIGTLLVLHYSEDITQVLRCPLEEKSLDQERRIAIRP